MKRPVLFLLAGLSLGVAQANSFDYVLWKGSPKWENGVMKWYYNPAGQPATVTTDSMLALIQADMQKWSDVCAIHFEYQGTTINSPTEYDGISVIGWASANGYDGYTQYWYRSGYFSDVDIRLDPTRLTSTPQLDGILTHELGHAVGLDHSDEAAAIMFANPYHSYAYQQTLRDDDIAGCRALYGTPAAATPYRFEIIASGAINALNLSARITIATEDHGASGQIYVAFRLGALWYFHNGSTWVRWTGGTIPAYTAGPLMDTTANVGSGIDGNTLAGGQIVVGYGRDEAEMLAAQRYATIYTFSR